MPSEPCASGLARVTRQSNFETCLLSNVPSGVGALDGLALASPLDGRTSLLVFERASFSIVFLSVTALAAVTAMEDLDARSGDVSAGAGAPVLDGAGAQRNDFRAYLATLEQEILVREAAMDSGQRFLKSSLLGDFTWQLSWGTDFSELVSGGCPRHSRAFPGPARQTRTRLSWRKRLWSLRMRQGLRVCFGNFELCSCLLCLHIWTMRDGSSRE
jgi:hypothetical protein